MNIVYILAQANGGVLDCPLFTLLMGSVLSIPAYKDGDKNMFRAWPSCLYC